MVDGMRGIRQAWPAAVVGGFVFALGQFACSNYISVELTDIVASLLATGAIVAPAPGLAAERADPRRGRFQRGPADRRRGRRRLGSRPRCSAKDEHRDSRGEVLGAYAPYLIIIAVFALAQLGRRSRRSRGLGPVSSAWPGLDVTNADGEAVSRPRSSSTGPAPRARCCSSPAC